MSDMRSIMIKSWVQVGVRNAFVSVVTEQGMRLHRLYRRVRVTLLQFFQGFIHFLKISALCSHSSIRPPPDLRNDDDGRRP